MILKKQNIPTKIMNRNKGNIYLELPFSSSISKDKPTPLKNFPSKRFM